MAGARRLGRDLPSLRRATLLAPALGDTSHSRLAALWVCAARRSRRRMLTQRGPKHRNLPISLLTSTLSASSLTSTSPALPHLSVTAPYVAQVHGDRAGAAPAARRTRPMARLSSREAGLKRFHMPWGPTITLPPQTHIPHTPRRAPFVHTPHSLYQRCTRGVPEGVRTSCACGSNVSNILIPRPRGAAPRTRPPLRWASLTLCVGCPQTPALRVAPPGCPTRTVRVAC